jgi:hypothetical protein
MNLRTFGSTAAAVTKALSALNIQSRPALVTGVRGNKLIGISDIPTAGFMEKPGIISKNKVNGIYSFPFPVDNHDGTRPKSCGIHSIEDNGVLRCGCLRLKPLGNCARINNLALKGEICCSQKVVALRGLIPF